MVNVRQSNLLTGKLGEGNYTPAEVTLYETLRQHVADGDSLVISTKQEIFDFPDEVEAKGGNGK